MAHAVAARSLSSLNEIADTPPLNPPLQLEGEEPLVLYIARVPGSRDIFLTTMKPRDKVVSAHDVESSLYYCHLSSDQDAELLDAEPSHDQVEKLDRGGHGVDYAPIDSRQSIPKQPDLPPRHSLVGPGLSQLQTQSTPASRRDWPTSPSKHRINRKPVEKRNVARENVLEQKSTQQQKILGPRPIPQRDGRSSQVSMREIDAMATSSDDSVRLYQNSVKDNIYELQRLQPSVPILTPVSTHENITSEQRCMTLIRRDPATGDQWNVAQLTLDQDRYPSSPSRSPNRKDKNVQMDIFGAGYSRFSKGPSEKPAIFTSRLKFCSTDARPNDTSSLRSPTTSSSRNFSFVTPWETMCTFSTAANGRVMKCYHALPTVLLSPSAQAQSGGKPPSMLVSELRFNLPAFGEKASAKKKENRRPLSFSSNSFGKLGLSSNIGEQKPMNAAPMSPRLPMRPKSYQGVPLGRLEAGLGRNGNRARNSAATDQSDESEYDESQDIELDLSLGQEMAGGGFGGNKAKLGKLIVYGGQGLAMLDLVVSANMGVWFNDLLAL